MKDTDRLDQLLVEFDQMKRKLEADGEGGNITLKLVSKISKAIAEKLNPDILMLARASVDKRLGSTIESAKIAQTMLSSLSSFLEITEGSGKVDSSSNDGAWLANHLSDLLCGIRLSGCALSEDFDEVAFETVVLYYLKTTGQNDALKNFLCAETSDAVSASQSPVLNFASFVPAPARRENTRPRLFSKCIAKLMSRTISLSNDLAAYKEGPEVAQSFVSSWSAAFSTAASLEQDWKTLLFLDSSSADDQAVSSLTSALEGTLANADKAFSKVLTSAPASGSQETTVGFRLRKVGLESVSKWTLDHGYEIDLRAALAKLAKGVPPKPDGVEKLLPSTMRTTNTYEALLSAYYVLVRNSSTDFKRRHAEELEKIETVFVDLGKSTHACLLSMYSKAFKLDTLAHCIEQMKTGYVEAHFVDMSVALASAQKFMPHEVSKPFARAFEKCFFLEQLPPLKSMPEDMKELVTLLSAAASWLQALGTDSPSASSTMFVLLQLTSDCVQCMLVACADRKKSIPLCQAVPDLVSEWLIAAITRVVTPLPESFLAMCAGASSKAKVLSEA